MKLCIVIVNYNVRYFLEQTLHSVRIAVRGLDCETWVVDNNSVDGSMEMVAEKFPEVHRIENKENLGFAKANNLAIRKSDSEYVLLLNPDTVLQEDTLSKCIAYMDGDTSCGALGVRMIDGKGKFLPESKRGLPTPAVALYKMSGLSALFPKSRVLGKYHLGYLDEFSNHHVDVLSGAFMMMRRTTLDKTGLLDEDFFMYGEDVDLSYRISQAGYKNIYFSGTTIIHYKGESTKKRSANYVKVFYNAMVLFAKKHYSKNTAGWFAFFINLAIWLRAGLALVFRALKNIITPLLDFILIYAGFYGITWYWEVYNKFVRKYYPDEYFYLHIPAYILFIQFTIWLSGGYDRPLSGKRLIRGAAIGSVLLFAIYAFLPKDLQFSRAILLLGCAWAMVAPLILRMAEQFLKRGNLKLGADEAQRIVIVACPEEGDRIRKLLSQSLVQHEFLGLVSPGEDKPADYIGNLSQFSEICDIFRINLCIFSAADVSSADIMHYMSAYSNTDLNFKIVPQNSLFVVGSNSRNLPGELYTIDVKFNIAGAHTKRKRRISDLLIAACCLVLSPVLVFFKNGRRFLSALPAVIAGTRTWVSYGSDAESAHLPWLKPGVFHPAEVYRKKELLEYINLAYARDYSVYRDWEICWKILRG